MSLDMVPNTSKTERMDKYGKLYFVRVYILNVMLVG